MARKRDQYDTLDPRAHMGLVYKWAAWAAKRYGGEREEYIGPAYLGLLDGLRTFNPAKCGRVSTHLTHTIRWKLDTFSKHEQRGGRRIPAERTYRFMASLEALTEKDSGYDWQGFITQADTNKRIDERDAIQEGMGRLLNCASSAHKQARTILQLYGRGYTLEEIGSELGFSRERVRQIIDRVRERLGAPRGGYKRTTSRVAKRHRRQTETTAKKEAA